MPLPTSQLETGALFSKSAVHWIFDELLDCSSGDRDTNKANSFLGQFVLRSTLLRIRVNIPGRRVDEVDRIGHITHQQRPDGHSLRFLASKATAA